MADHVGHLVQHLRRLAPSVADPEGDVEDASSEGFGDAGSITQDAPSSVYELRPGALPCVLGA
jgi:hypothetical protein